LLKNERERLPEREVRATTFRLGRVSMAVRRWGLTDEGTENRVKLPVDGGKRIFGPRSVYKSLQPNQTYIAYYVPVWTWWGYRLLSVEPREAEQMKTKQPPRRKTKGKRG
ncbi:MAG: hypothetical protein JXA10_18110, partial [Anaerolineae bacterium]|nr:hypothetical protein [Anaerolineae bacterium]